MKESAPRHEGDCGGNVLNFVNTGDTTMVAVVRGATGSIRIQEGGDTDVKSANPHILNDHGLW